MLIYIPQTSGSISSPAEKAAVVGIKPTVGLTSRYGTYAISEWQDTVGVLARSVCDAATLLTAIVGSYGQLCSRVYLIQIGPDPNDPFTISYPNDEESVQKPAEGTDFAAACDSASLSGIRVAVRRLLVTLGEN